MPEWLLTWPTLLVAGGIVAVLWSVRDRFGRLLPKRESLVASERFDRYLALRGWCEANGQADAARALDEIVLPALVRTPKEPS